MDLKEKKATYDDGPHGGSELPDVVTAEGGEVQKRKADAELKKVSESFAAIFEGVDLPEDFATKAEAILESAIKEQVDAARVEIEESADARIAEIAESLETQFGQAADKYLDFVAERWIKENKVAVVSEAKVATATALVEGLLELLGTHNIKVEESTYDRVETLEKTLGESRSNYSALAEEMIALKATNAKLMAEAALHEIQEGMVLTDAERLASLVEDFDHSDITKYRMKVEAVKLAHFNESKAPAVDKGAELNEEFIPEEVKESAKVSVMTEDLRRFMGGK